MDDIGAKSGGINGDGGAGTGKLLATLGYEFRIPMLLEEALTHSSAADLGSDDLPFPCNERLEFLGDAVLDLVISARLMDLEEGYREGLMSKIRASLVCEAQLSQIARELGLSDLVRLGRGELRSGGKDKDSILADTFEAIIGAIYIDGGYLEAQRIINNLYDPIFAEGSYLALMTDYKSMLQEFTQEKLGCCPEYVVMAQEGFAHKPIFKVSAVIEGKEIGFGEASSKKRASQIAAQAGLDNLQVVRKEVR